jgi:hypothetical protein
MSQLPSERPADRPDHAPALRPGPLPPYQLILHRGDEDMMHVIRTIMELTRFCVAEATHKMWEAQHSGRSPLLVTHKERAELFAEQFGERGLQVSIEAV